MYVVFVSSSLIFALYFLLQETIKQLQEEVSCIEEAQSVLGSFSDWLSAAQHNFGSVAVPVDAVDRFAMERKMKKLEVHMQTVFVAFKHLC